MDFQGKITTYPYVAPSSTVTQGTSSGSSGSSSSSSVSSNTISGLESFIAQAEKAITLIPTSVGSTGTPGAFSVGNDSWATASIADLTFIKTMTNNLNQALKGLNALVSVLTKVLRIVQLFISGFNSFSKLILAAINYTQTQLNKYANDALKFGLYVNIVAPPAFYSKNPNDTNTVMKSRGGFDGFISRLQGSLNDTSDKNRPTFNDTSLVGGWVILLDAESTDKIFTGLQQLTSMFDFMHLFGLNLAPPAPKNLQGKCGLFQKPGDTTKNFGIQVQWDQNYMSSAFLLSRSQSPGGVLKTVPYVPTCLMDNKETGEQGLITVAKDLIADLFAGVPYTPPTKDEIVYEDPSFPAVLISNPGFSTTVSYIDTNIPDGVPCLYYVAQACGEGGLIKGPYSTELCVPIKKCNDAFNVADIIAQPNARFEFISVGGMGQLGKWSSIQMTAMIPWFVEIIGELNKLINAVKGMIKSASDSFLDFLNQIAAKVQLFINIINTIAYIIDAFKTFILGESISFLELPPVIGGMSNFVQRIKNAKPPVVNGQQQNFSGPDGISIGVVFTYGAGGADVALAQTIAKSLSFITSLFVSK
jgi:hypothetical protein